MDTVMDRGPESIIEQAVAARLADWPGLRLYLARRRAGAPTDATMERLLTEMLRSQFGERADLGHIVERVLDAGARV